MSIRTLSKELQEIARNELNEDSNRIQDDIKHIRDWLKKQAHLNARNDDQWLLGFLRHAKFSLERTKEKLDHYYTIRSIAPELFERDPFCPEMQEILKQGVITVTTDPFQQSLPAVLIIRWKKADPEKVSMLNLLKTLLIITDIVMNEKDNIIINGMHIIEDIGEMSLSYLSQITPSICKKAMISIQDVCPIRVKGLHFINVNPYFEAAIKMCKSFMNEKMKKRFNVYSGNHKSIYKDIPLSVLPKEYGGKGGSLDEIAAEWKKKVESYSDWLLDDAQYGTDESKRPGKPKLVVDVFGADGSFRKLNID